MSQHISPEQAAQWVAGLTEGAEATEFERHLTGCGPCEQLVQREARAELALAQAVRLTANALPSAESNVVPLRRRSAVSYAVAAAVLAAAASVLVVVRQGSTAATERSSLSAALLDAGDDDFEPLVAAPHYEEGVELPAVALTANQPFPL